VAMAVGAEIPTCSVAASTGFEAATGTLRLTALPNEELVIEPVGAALQVNGRACVTSSGATLLLGVVNAIVVTGTTGDDTVSVGLSRGAFPASFLGARGGGVRFDTLGGGRDELRVVGTANSDVITAGVNGGRVFVDFDGDGFADVRWDSAASARAIAILGGAGDDRMSGSARTLTPAAIPLRATAKLADAALAPGALSPLGIPLRLLGMDGADHLQGGDGDDTLAGGAGDDRLYAAANADGADTFVGDEGSDTADYSARTAPLELTLANGAAAEANDGLPGEGDDLTQTMENVVGGRANDVLVGNGSPNELRGGPGNDRIASGPAGTCATDADRLFGDEGDDVFELGAASDCADRVSGGAGYDVATYHDRATAVTVRHDDVANDGAPGEGDDIRTDVEEIVGGNGNDTLSGGNVAVRILGCGGDDTLTGSPLADSLSGGPGADVVSGLAGDDTLLESGMDAGCASSVLGLSSPNRGAGADVLNGGAGIFDIVDYGQRTEPLALTLCADDTAAAGAGVRCANSGDDGAAGERDNVINVEVVEGGDGDDRVEGCAADEWLRGNGGDDVLLSGGGNDTLDGGAGRNTLQGGPGAVMCQNYAQSTMCSLHVFTCNVGAWQDCDRDPANACESDTASDARNCGACGVACASGTACVAGVCQ
jgi:Ca2+-binding RTX toxin-like protein